MKTNITTQVGLNKINFCEVEEDVFWNSADEKEVRMHKIHVYPAKFPSLIAQKAFEYAQNKIQVNTVVDIFCGCGTVAVEAQRRGINFWGCDINPVAVMISKAKTASYDIQMVKQVGNSIIDRFNKDESTYDYGNASERLRYWFHEDKYNDLAKLKSAIEKETIDDEYRNLFTCLFSSILKASSKWLASSIKPQIDPRKHIDPSKKPIEVIALFKKQFDIAIKAINEVAYNAGQYNCVEILHQNVLNVEYQEFADMIVTSPPYVTSYEYADLHQLSVLWLGYADDYTELRKGSIGSSYGTEKKSSTELLPTARKIVDYFEQGLSQSRSIARYYNDMRKFVKKSYDMLVSGGIVVFVIGDTELKGKLIENAKCLCESMIDCGYVIKEISKRKIQNKFLPSHRGENGKFSSSKDDRVIYSQEYIVIGRKV